jgi:hypothetical protein
MTKRSCLPILAAFLTVVQLLNPAFAQAATGADHPPRSSLR